MLLGKVDRVFTDASDGGVISESQWQSAGVLESMRTPAALGESTARVQKIPIKREKHDVDVFDWTTLV